MALNLGEHDDCGAEVGRTEGAPLETADAQVESQLGAERPDPRSSVGCRPTEQRGGSQGDHTDSSGRDGTGRVLATGMLRVLACSVS